MIWIFAFLKCHCLPATCDVFYCCHCTVQQILYPPSGPSQYGAKVSLAYGGGLAIVASLPVSPYYTGYGTFSLPQLFIVAHMFVST